MKKKTTYEFYSKIDPNREGSGFIVLGYTRTIRKCKKLYNYWQKRKVNVMVYRTVEMKNKFKTILTKFKL